MSNALTLSAAVAGLLGVLTPLLTAVVQQPRWSPRTRSLVGLFVAVVLGVAATVAQGAFHIGIGQAGALDWPSVLATVTAVVVASQAAYTALWKPTGLAQVVELKTSPRFVMPEPPAGRHEAA